MFNKWKKVVKKKEYSNEDLILKSNKIDKCSDEELLRKAATIFKTQLEFVPKTAKKMPHFKKISKLKVVV